MGFVCIINIAMTEVNCFITPSGACDILLISEECCVQPTAIEIPRHEDMGQEVRIQNDEHS